jgi:protein-S-isoprenylcysteine O-methyltransferase Ste14
VLETLGSTIVVPGGILVLLPYLLLSWSSDCCSFDAGRLRVVGMIPIVLGLGLLFWCVRDFITHGRGTPNPLEPPRFLVARGPYRVVRNPMYLSMGLVLAGEALWLGSFALLGYLAAIMAMLHAFVVIYEEPALERLFDGAYEDYRDRVPRWIPNELSRW